MIQPFALSFWPRVQRCLGVITSIRAAAHLLEPTKMERAVLTNALRDHGSDAVSFQTLEPGLQHWGERGAVVSYCETSGAWVAAGGPLAPRADRGEIAARFVVEARRAGRRASFFACDD